MEVCNQGGEGRPDGSSGQVGRPKIRGVRVSTSHKAKVAHVHLGPISLLPTKNALGQPLEQIH